MSDGDRPGGAPAARAEADLACGQAGLPTAPPPRLATPLAELAALDALPGVPACRLGESPVWHPVEHCLYWCDIPGQALHRFDPERGTHRQWELQAEPGCVVPVLGGGLVVPMRDGLWLLQGEAMQRRKLADPPFDPARQRFNDGKADAQGRLWVGTIDDRREPQAVLYRWTPAGGFEAMAGDVAASNGLAFTADGRDVLWADTRRHQVWRLQQGPERRRIQHRSLWHAFAPRADGQPLSAYGGRPDGAAMDQQGAYWVAMFEGAQIVRLDAQGHWLQRLALPVRCPTMPAFGGRDGRTLFITTAREQRPADELAEQPLAGRVLQLRCSVPGLPAHLLQL